MTTPDRDRIRVNMTAAEIDAVFTEWERRYREEPDQYTKDWSQVSEEDYGAAAGTYFRKLVEAVFANRTAVDEVAALKQRVDDIKARERDRVAEFQRGLEHAKGNHPDLD